MTADFWKTRRVLRTGASGFLGSHVVRTLEQHHPEALWMAWCREFMRCA